MTPLELANQIANTIFENVTDDDSFYNHYKTYHGVSEKYVINILEDEINSAIIKNNIVNEILNDMKNDTDLFRNPEGGECYFDRGELDTYQNYESSIDNYITKMIEETPVHTISLSYNINDIINIQGDEDFKGRIKLDISRDYYLSSDIVIKNTRLEVARNQNVIFLVEFQEFKQ